MQHRYQDLIEIFNRLFKVSEGTVLVKGDDEPVYLPRDEVHAEDRVIFAHGFYASALHEISHWCIAGSGRRRKVDYGYWYQPDGRTPEQQREFESVEVKPQALEWIFAEAANFRFNLSLDNLSGGGAGDLDQFAHNVCTQARNYIQWGLPARADHFYQALLEFYRQGQRLNASLFQIERLNLPAAAPA